MSVKTKEIVTLAVRDQKNSGFLIEVNEEGEPLLNINPESVEEHLRQAVERYGFGNVLLVKTCPFHAKAQIDIWKKT